MGKKYTMKPWASADITVHISGMVRHDNGDNPDTYFIVFQSAIDFAAWLEFATVAMREKSAIAIDHHYYNTYEMVPERIIIGGHVDRKFRKVYDNVKALNPE